MPRKPRNRIQQRASNQVESVEVVKEPKETYALVLYDGDSTKGVIQTKKLDSKSRVKGSKCLVPEPVDWKPEELTGKKHPAKVIEFGWDIDFLYDMIRLGKDGSIDEDFALSNELLAEKKVCHRKELEKTAQKVLSLKEADRGSNELIHVHDIIDVPQIAKPNAENFAALLCHSRCNGTYRTCPFLDIINEAAAPGEIQLLVKLDQAAKKHKEFERERHMENEQRQMQQRRRTREVLKYETMECAKPGEGTKYQLVAGKAVYVDKAVYASFPAVKSSKTPNASVTIRGMVGLLLDALIPREMQKHYTATTIPLIIVEAIMAFVNMRLNDFEREPIENYNEYVTDHLRKGRRDREGEKKRRVDKMAKGIDISRKKKASKNSTVTATVTVPVTETLNDGTKVYSLQLDS